MEHYYTPQPKSKIVEQTFSRTFFKTEIKFTTASGLFSQQHLDEGTLLLLKKSIFLSTWNILDLGCGYGPVGIVFKKLNPNMRVTFSDVNERAIEYTKKNLEQNNIPMDESITLIQSDGFANISKDENKKFDAIYLNPPQSAGKQLCFDLITKSKEYLVPEGNLQIVARKNKGGATLAKHMEEVFGNVDVVDRKNGFWIYISYNKI